MTEANEFKLLFQVGIKQVHDLPGVGKNLRNHVTFYITYFLNHVKDTSDLDWATALDYILNKRGPMTSTGNILSFRSSARSFNSNQMWFYDFHYILITEKNRFKTNF